ncbi:MAG: 23S rRNA (pseudouridine(1915)-N(3))-methyltransferase RlmH [Oscillospiraceae bacterium]|nr:23S rRNA (pseudouridine(1915)-N(3))-methyltransferase RlmH [Oscillospiraceae bacterium]
MLQVTILCVGKLKERFFSDASAEYIKRLGAYCRTEVVELPEAKRPRDPSPAETAAAVLKEGDALLARLPKGALTVALCVEGKEIASEDVAGLLKKAASSGAGKLCFVIGGSDGLDARVKQAADERISMSRMTFPHHLARVMLLEQVYRGFKIEEGSRYHK